MGGIWPSVIHVVIPSLATWWHTGITALVWQHILINKLFLFMSMFIRTKS